MPNFPSRIPPTSTSIPPTAMPPHPITPNAPWAGNVTAPPVPPPSPVPQPGTPPPSSSSSSPGTVTHDRGNHDDRRYGLTASQGSITIPDQLIEQQQEAESANQEYPVVQEAVPPRPLGL